MLLPIYPLRLYFRQLPVVIPLALSILANLAMWGWLLWFISPVEEPIFLHYNVLFGVDYIGEWWRVYTLPLVGLVILLVNGILGWSLASRDLVIAYIVNTVACICQILLLVMAILVVRINI